MTIKPDLPLNPPVCRWAAAMILDPGANGLDLETRLG
jgi:hypothetical protein